MEDNRTELSGVGEFGMIDKIKSLLPNTFHHTTTKVGIGDDAAIIDMAGKQVLVTTDMLLEGVHFNLMYMPIKHLGYKAVAVNVSDIAAMNGVPQQITIGLGVSNRFSMEAVEAFYEGVRAACDNYKVDLVGGDTTSSQSGMVVSVTALGMVAHGNEVRRDGAQKGDIVCVTGDLGGAYIGLQALERERQVFLANPQMQPKLDGLEYIVARQLRPEARMDIVHELAELEIKPSAMIDVSDGLASEVLHIAKASDKGIRIYEDKLPIDKVTYDTAVGFNIDPITCALNGGEDYELLFTIKQEDYEKIKMHADIHFIGYVTEEDEPSHLVTKGGKIVPLQAQGWNHFAGDDTGQ